MGGVDVIRGGGGEDAVSQSGGVMVEKGDCREGRVLEVWASGEGVSSHVGGSCKVVDGVIE